MSSNRRIRLSRSARTGTLRTRSYAVAAMITALSLTLSGLVIAAPANALVPGEDPGTTTVVDTTPTDTTPTDTTPTDTTPTDTTPTDTTPTDTTPTDTTPTDTTPTDTTPTDTTPTDTTPTDTTPTDTTPTDTTPTDTTPDPTFTPDPASTDSSTAGSSQSTSSGSGSTGTGSGAGESSGSTPSNTSTESSTASSSSDPSPSSTDLTEPLLLDGTTLDTNNLLTDTTTCAADATVTDSATASQVPTGVDITTTETCAAVVSIDPTLSATKSVYYPGGNVALSGSDWTEDTSVSLTATDADGNVIHDGTASVDSAGTFGELFSLAKDAVAGSVTVKAKGATSDQVAKTSFDVKALPVPTVESDKADYTAGALVNLAGTGWSGDTAVNIVVNDTYGASWRRVVDVPITDSGDLKDQFRLPMWFVSDYDVTVRGNDTGRVAKTAFTDNPPKIGIEQCRNGKATNSEDCTGNAWQTGNLGSQQAHLLEGYSTPFRSVMTNLPDDTLITVVIGYDIKDSGKHAYDYLTYFDRLEPHNQFGHAAEDVFPTSGTSFDGDDVPDDTEPIDPPASTNSPVAGQPTADFGALGAGDNLMSIWGGNLLDVVNTVDGDLNAAHSEAQVSVSFRTRANSGDPVDAVLAWGGHIAKCTVWGTDPQSGECLSATGVSGSPYHMRIIGWSFDPNLDPDGLGNMDRSMSADAVYVPEGSIELKKVWVNGSGSTTLAIKDATGTVVDDGNGTLAQKLVTTNDTTGDFLVAPGAFTVQETAITGFASALFCFNDANQDGSQQLPGEATLINKAATISESVNVADGQHVVCTFTNTRNLGTLTVTKNLTDGGSGFAGPIPVTVTCPNVPGSPFTHNLLKSENWSWTVSTTLPTGTVCTVDEGSVTAPTGYSWTTYEAFTETNSDPAGDPNSGTDGVVKVKDVSGTTVGVTIANTLTRNLGTLTVTKNLTDGGSGFAGPIPVTVTCPNVPGSPFTHNLLKSENWSWTVSTTLPTGTVCTVDEGSVTAPTGYSWTTYEAFTETNSDPAGDPNSGTDGVVKVKDVSGTTVGVTIANTLTRNLGTLTVTKNLTDGGSGFAGPIPVTVTCPNVPGSPFTHNLLKSENWSWTVSTTLPTGTVCTVDEGSVTAPTGYSWTTYEAFTETNSDPAGDPNSGTDGVVKVKDVSGTTVGVTIANTLTRNLGTLTVTKNLTDGGSGFAGPIPVTVTCPNVPGSPFTHNLLKSENWSWTVSTTLPTGTVCTVDEGSVTAPTGYSWTTYEAFTETNSDPAGDPNSGTDGVVKVKDVSGTTVGVTIANTLTRNLGTLTVTKNLTDGGSGFAGPIPVTVTCPNVPGSPFTHNLLKSENWSWTVSTTLPTGTVCTVDEGSVTAPTGYSWTTYEAFTETNSDPAGDPNSGTDGVVKVKDVSGTTVGVTIANTLTRNLGTLTVTKNLTDGGSGFAGPIPVTVTCPNVPGSPFTHNLLKSENWSWTVSTTLPTGTVCTVDEGSVTAPTGYSWTTYEAFTETNSDPAGDPNSGTDGVVKVKDVSGTTVGVTIANTLTRNLGTLTVTKNLTDGGSGFAGPIPVTVTCPNVPGSPFTHNLLKSENWSWTVSTTLPTGTVCTVDEGSVTAPTGYSWTTYEAFTETNSDPAGDPNSGTDGVVKVKDVSGTTVGVTIANTLTRNLGTLTVTKNLTDGGSGFAGPIPVTVTCPNVPGSPFTHNLLKSENWSWTVSTTLPTGTVCTVDEGSVTAPTGYSWTTYEAFTETNSDPAGDPNSGTDGVVKVKDVSGTTVGVTIANTLTRNLGTLTVTKNLTDGGSGFAGPIPVTVTCPNVPGSPFTHNLLKSENWSWTVSTTLPTGTVCTVDEGSVTAPTGYSWTTYEAFTETNSDPAGDPNSGTDGVVKVKDVSGTTVGVTIANTLTRNLGSLTVSKNLTDGGSGFDEVFPVTVTCPNVEGSPFELDLAADGKSQLVSDQIPTGTVCTVTETDQANVPAPTGYRWTQWSGFTETGSDESEPENDGAVTIPDQDGADVSLTVNNTLTRNLGSLTVSKNLTDGGSGFDEVFPVTVTCPNVEGSPFELDLAADGKSQLVSDQIPTGTVCTVTETDQANVPAPTGYRWTQWSGFTETGSDESEPENDGAVTIPDQDGADVSLTVNNTLTRNLGSLTVSKNLTDGGSGFDEVFPVTVTCPNVEGSPFELDLAADGKSQLVSDQIPTGTVCTVTETDQANVPAPTGYRWTQWSGFTETGSDESEPENDGAVTIPDQDGADVSLTVNNTLTRNLGHLQIAKVVTGTAPEGASGTFPMSYRCTFRGDDDITGTVNVQGGQVVTVPDEGGIPTGYSCTVTEGTLPGLPQYYSWVNSPSYANNQDTTPGNVVVVGDDPVLGEDEVPVGDPVARVTVTNTIAFNPPGPGLGGLTITKTLTGGPAGYKGPFQVQYSCTKDGPSGTVSINAGGSVTIGNVPNGSVCSATENSLPTAPDGYEWGTPVISGSPTDPITASAGGKITVANQLTELPVAAPVLPATVAEPPAPTFVAVPAKATIPTSVPAGGGYYGPRKDVPTGLLILMFVGLVGAVAAATRKRVLR